MVSTCNADWASSDSTPLARLACGAAACAAPRFGMSLKFYIRWFEYQDLGFSMREANQQWNFENIAGHNKEYTVEIRGF